MTTGAKRTLCAFLTIGTRPPVDAVEAGKQHLESGHTWTWTEEQVSFLLYSEAQAVRGAFRVGVLFGLVAAAVAMWVAS